MSKEKKKFKFKKSYGIVIGILVILITVCLGVWIYIKPMLVSGKIVEIPGKVTAYNKSFVTVQSSDGTYKCKIKSDTYMVNNYEIKVGDEITVICNYDEKKTNDKNVEARRIYKNKQKEEP